MCAQGLRPQRRRASAGADRGSVGEDDDPSFRHGRGEPDGDHRGRPEASGLFDEPVEGRHAGGAERGPGIVVDCGRSFRGDEPDLVGSAVREGREADDGKEGELPIFGVGPGGVPARVAVPVGQVEGGQLVVDHGTRGYAPPIMRISIVTIFPEYFASAVEVGIVGRAVTLGRLAVDPVDLRRWGKGVHRQVDDAPFGGGPGMVMMPEPLAAALDSLSGAHRVLLTPGGAPLVQAHLDRWATLDHLALVCGRYEGVDERFAEHFIDEEISLGDFVLAGGEAAALVIVEGVARLLPGVVGNPASLVSESFRGGTLEEPQYTRPAAFRGWPVPDVLLSGDHGRIEEWRREQREARTRARRPDLGDGTSSGDPV